MIRKGAVSPNRVWLLPGFVAGFRLYDSPLSANAMIRPFFSLFVLLFACVASVGGVQAEEPQVAWPQGWVVEPLPADAASPGPLRQRATKSDSAGNAVMVMELTTTTVEPDHQVNLQGVLLEMRKSIQKDFSRVVTKVSALRSMLPCWGRNCIGNHLHDHAKRTACIVSDTRRGTE